MADVESAVTLALEAAPVEAAAPAAPPVASSSRSRFLRAAGAFAAVLEAKIFVPGAPDIFKRASPNPGTDAELYSMRIRRFAPLLSSALHSVLFTE